MLKLFKTTVTTLVIIVSIFLIAQHAEAAILSMSPQQKEYALNETFLVEVRLDSEYQVINAVAGVITYPPDKLEVVEVSRGGSFLTLWVKEPAVEKTAGIITFAGGIPNGSLVVDGKVLTVVFKTKAPGRSEVSFEETATSVRLNDGQGTAADLKFMPAVYQTGNISFISIISPTHPDENGWYQNKDFTVQWEVKKDAYYSYILSTDPDEKPDNHRETTDGQVTFFDLSDGVYYFILKETIPGRQEWEIVGRRRAMIDTTPPLPFEAVISRENTLFDGQYFLIFSTVDKGSGVDHYNIIEGGEVVRNAVSPYVLKDQSPQQTLIVKAFDKAGNSREFSFGITETAASSSGNYTGYLIIGLAILLLVILLFVIRKKSFR